MPVNSHHNTVAHTDVGTVRSTFPAWVLGQNNVVTVTSFSCACRVFTVICRLDPRSMLFLLLLLLLLLTDVL